MRTIIPTAIAALALPLMAVAQTDTQQQTQQQTKETEKGQTKGKKMHSPEDSNKPDTQWDRGKSDPGKNTRTQPDVNTRAGHDANRNTDMGSNRTTETNTNGMNRTTVNKQEFRSHHEEVFKLGRHPKEFFIERYGANHFRMIGNTYFVFVDNCWVSVDVDGVVYAERVICPGDPEYTVVD